MKNLKYFPFERNRYFYGKLLTVDDFETEQKYMNDKRRMINRFLLGTGVVCGMNVVEVDTKSVSIEMGLALDFSGREIVIDTPVIKRLELIDGFHNGEDELEDNGNYDETLYLCVEYAETEKDPVHNVAGGGNSLQQVEYNKYREGYHLFITEKAPDESSFGMLGSYQDRQTLYWENGIRIQQICPKYATAQEETELTVVVENFGQSQPVRFSYELDLTYLSYQGSNHLTVDFDESKLEKSSRYTLRFPLKAMPVDDARGTAAVKAGSVSLWLGPTQLSPEIQAESGVQIIHGDVKEAILHHYYNSAMEEIAENSEQPSICLARIQLIRSKNRYSIRSVEGLASRQAVLNLPLVSVLSQLTNRELERLGEGRPAKENSFAEETALTVRRQELQWNTGVIRMDLGLGGKKGQRFFSEEISHGLGLGAVTILLSMDSVTEPGRILYSGSPEIFDLENDQFGAELASQLDMGKGVFRIGLRLTAASPQRYVTVRWTALRDKADAPEEKAQTQLFIKPNMAELRTRESLSFEAVCPKMPDQRVRWTVKSAEGGSIDKNGCYTAPNTAGVYEIVAQSISDPKMTASAFAVVRDPAAPKE